MIIKLTFTRPSESVNFYDDPAFVRHLVKTYIDPGKIQVSTEVKSLVREVKMTLSETAWAEFKADPVVVAYSAQRDAYNKLHKIKSAIS